MKKSLTALTVLLVSALISFGGPTYEMRPTNVPAKDTLSVLCIGNSFTYHYDTYNMLEEIAASQGHKLKIKAAYVGGYSFKRHLCDVKTIKAIETWNNPYEYVFLQNQSQLNAFVGRNPKQHRPALEDAVQLVRRVREFSPDAVIFFESTWSYPAVNYGGFGSYEEYDRYMTKGTALMVKKTKSELSPIGEAFAIIRAKHPEIDLLNTDRKHQSLLGAYLKSCVNYLMIFGSGFDANVSNCTIDKDIAEALRQAALEAVK